MARLSTADYCGILEVIHTAGESDAVEPFPQPVLEGLARLIPCDLVSYGDYDRMRGHRRPPFSLLPRKPPRSATASSAWATLRHTDPLLPHRTHAQALRISDVLTSREWHEHPLYRTIARAEGIEHMLRVWLVGPSGVIGGFDFDRAGLDFSERDRNILQTLAPHLLQHRLRTGSRPRAPAEDPALQTLTRREREILTIVAAGLTNRQIATRLSIAPGTVRKHLDNIYTKLNVPGRAAAIAATGIRSTTNPE